MKNIIDPRGKILAGCGKPLLFSYNPLEAISRPEMRRLYDGIDKSRLVESILLPCGYELTSSLVYRNLYPMRLDVIDEAAKFFKEVLVAQKTIPRDVGDRWTDWYSKHWWMKVHSNSDLFPRGAYVFHGEMIAAMAKAGFDYKLPNNKGKLRKHRSERVEFNVNKRKSISKLSNIEQL